MSYSEFVELIIGKIETREGSGVVVMHQTSNRVNCNKYGIVIKRKTARISPVIEIRDLYAKFQSGMTLESCLNEILKRDRMGREGCKEELVDEALRLNDWKYVSGRIYPRLLHTERNYEQLRSLVHRNFMDLSVYYEIKFDSENASVKVSGELAATWGVSEEVLYKTALENLEKEHYFYMDMEEMLVDMLKEKMGDDKEMLKEILADLQLEKAQPDVLEMFVLTNAEKQLGASGMLHKSILKKFAEEKQSDFYILPSSRHEVLLVPVENKLAGDLLKSTVRDVNGSEEMEEEDVLSDNVYYYSRFGECITMVDC